MIHNQKLPIVLCMTIFLVVNLLISCAPIQATESISTPTLEATTTLTTTQPPATPTLTQTPTQPTTTSILTKTPEFTPTREVSKTPDKKFMTEAFYNIAEWKKYPEVKLDDITSGKIADTLRASGTLKPFDKSKLIPWDKLFMFNNGLYSTFYYPYNDASTVLARNDYDARPMRTIGGLTVVLPDGSKALGWVVQIATDEPNTESGYVIATVLRAAPAMFPTEELSKGAEAWLNKTTKNMQDEGGGYPSPFYLININEIKKYPGNITAEPWIPDFLKKIGYDPTYEGDFGLWASGHARAAVLEKMKLVGYLNIY